MKKPKHISASEPVATVQIHAYWGSLQKDYITCGDHNALQQLEALKARMDRSCPTPVRCSYVMSKRSYKVATDSYSGWRPVARYNHLGLEIML